ncbi:MAG TPA: DinB family protein [Gemmatimonadaceae bacterium]
MSDKPHSSRRWQRAAADHRAAASEFAACIETVPDELWRAPIALGKWSPAEEALHIQNVYAVLLATLKGGPGLRSRVSERRALFIQRVMFPLFLAVGRLPRGFRAPREVSPNLVEAGRLPRANRAGEIRRLATEFEEALAAAEASGRTIALRHPYFGLLNGVLSLRFVALHTRHHLRNLPR